MATLHANDSLLDLGTRRWHATSIREHSFEAELKALYQPYAFVTSNQKAMQSPKQTRLLNFIDFTEARLDQLHDGYLFIQKATLPKRDLKNTSISSQ